MEIIWYNYAEPCSAINKKMYRTTPLLILKCPDCEHELTEFDFGSGIHHCINPHCRFQFFDKNTGKKHRKN